MRLNKSQREQVKRKFGGLCAYCGHPLPDRWHADHLIAVERESWGTNKGVMQKPQHDTIGNMMPSCPPCNRSKHKLNLEEWRSWLAGHMCSLNSYNSVYRLMLAYGCVVETGRPITFHFERVRYKEPS